MAQICVPVLALLVLCTIGLNCSEAKSARRRGCCTMLDTAEIPIKAIRGFTIQTNEGKCRLNAVIFHTVKGNVRKSICVDLNLPWVNTAIETLKAQFKQMQRRKKQ